MKLKSLLQERPEKKKYKISQIKGNYSDKINPNID